jgi:peptidoglycan-N-acetylglucosamine deacetylase
MAAQSMARLDNESLRDLRPARPLRVIPSTSPGTALLRTVPLLVVGLLALVVGFVALDSQIAGASGLAQAPLQVQAASLTQNGQELVWSVRLTHPFSPAALGRHRRSVCLLIERVKNASVAGQVCLVGPQRGARQPRLEYMAVSAAGPGPPVVISASVTRSSTSALSASFVPSSFGHGYSSVRWQVLSALSSPNCTGPHRGRVGCYTTFPAKPALARLHTPRLVGCVPSGPDFVFHGPTSRREVALTFDDGPWYDTPQFLAVLEREHVVATFFEIGEQIATYGQGGAIERRMLADGDMIGDHTWSHANVAGAGSFAATQISDTAAAIRKATGGFTPCLFRAPGGSVSPALITQARSMSFTTIQWSVDPRDWARPGTSAIYNNVVANAQSGAIVLQHDGGGDRSQTLAALPGEINTLRAMGYQFVTVTQMLNQALIYK